MGFVIFDLDGTVIDSSHRHATHADGSIDLNHWRENCTAEKIAADTLLPLAELMRYYANAGAFVIICTARAFTSHDLDYLDNNSLPYNVLLHRDGPNDCRGDAELKIDLLNDLARFLAFDTMADFDAIMFDDNHKVIDAMRANGVLCFDAARYNRVIMG